MFLQLHRVLSSVRKSDQRAGRLTIKFVKLFVNRS
jgi:uncharacterized protein YwbE